MSNGSSKTTQIFFLYFSAILCLILVLSRLLEEYPRLRRYLSEPAMTLLVGITCSFLVRTFWNVDEGDLDAYEAQHAQGGDDAYGGGNVYNYNEYGEEDELPEFFLYFPSNVFFMALLPPILFNSGYQLQRELFYRHFLPIVLFSIVGTCLSAFGAGGFLILIQRLGWMGNFDFTIMELVTFGALIAATDTVSVVGVLQRKKVDPHLFSLVFGESALNDAVAIVRHVHVDGCVCAFDLRRPLRFFFLVCSIVRAPSLVHHLELFQVLFKTAADFLTRNSEGEHDNDSVGILFGSYLLDLVVQAVVSPILGIVFAGVMGLAFKWIDFRQHRMLEMSLYILPVYIPFIMSEILDLSGMITIFFTGIFARRYMEPNVSPATREYSLALFQLLSFLAETCIFLELGLSVFGLHKAFYFQFIAWAFVAALLGRALSIYPLSALFNFSLTRPVPVCGADMAISEGSSTPPNSLNTSIDMVNDLVTVPVVSDMAQGASIETMLAAAALNADNQDEEMASVASSKADGGGGGDGGGSVATASTTTAASLLSPRETPHRKRDKIIPVRFQHILCFAGLRGAVAYACAREFPDVYG